jgi:hypothetical protein
MNIPTISWSCKILTAHNLFKLVMCSSFTMKVVREDNILRDGNQMDKCTILISRKHMWCKVLGVQQEAFERGKLDSIHNEDEC